VDEARKVIRRLERIESLQSAQAPARELLREVRKLLSEGEAWLAVERGATCGPGSSTGARPCATDGAAAALDGCRARLAAEKRVAKAADSAAL
jgi:hypothetical protein